eukprot:gene13620-13746_t
MAPLGWGVFNPVSMFRVRILQTEAEALSALVDLRVSQAVALRAALGLPSESTNVMRLINSEGDRLSGVVADALGEVVVVQSCAAWSERYSDVITAAIQRHSGCKTVVWRPAAGILKEEGIEVQQQEQQQEEEKEDAATATAWADSESDSEFVSSGGTSLLSSLESSVAAATATAAEEKASGIRSVSDEDSDSGGGVPKQSHVERLLSDAVRVREAGVQFLASPGQGQKTGFYADQRLNRAFVASMAAGKTVLDLCCYSGGFALLAAAAGAAAVTGVDSSPAAVELAAANAKLNGLTDSTFLRAAIEGGEAFDIVVLDPPKLAPNRQSLGRATGAMTQSDGLGKVLQEAAAEAGRQLTLLAKSGAAPDHPLHPGYPEGEYLTALTYRVV